MGKEIAEILKIISTLSKKETKKLMEEMNKMLKGEKTSKAELLMIEIKKKMETERGILCPHCNSSNIIGHGNYRERKRYKCNECDKTFNDMTGTPMSWTHYPEKWKEYFKYMTEGRSLRYIAKELEIDLKTAFYWRHKILNAFQKIGCEKLEGIVEADETFFLSSEKGNKNLQNRKPRKRGGKAQKRGLSSEQIPVITSCDRNSHYIVGVAGGGRIHAPEVEKTLGKYVDESNTLCSDGERSYKIFTENHNMNHEIVKSKRGQRIKNIIYHIQNINNYHSRLKEWMRGFHGVATKYLSHYMHWFRILEKVKKRYDQLGLFIKNAFIVTEIISNACVISAKPQF